MLNIQKFIKSHSNWEELLASPPYSLNIKRKDTRILFKYSQIFSDPTLEIVKEARGLILEDETWNIVAYPFKRFFNYGEPAAAQVDWSSASVQAKEDGSLIKIYFYDGKWRVGTSGTIDAIDAELSSPLYKNFRELFDVAAEKSGLDYDKLDPHFTYCMELLSPENVVVCPQTSTRIVHLGTRDNRTCKEVEADIGVEKPKRYDLHSLKDCIEMAKTFDYTKEGFVVCDKNYNRIKVKSEDYLRVHRLANNGNITLENAVAVLRANEQNELLVYFPQYTTLFEDVKAQMQKVEEKIEELKEWHKDWIKADFGPKTGQRKRLAVAISNFQKWEKTVVFAIHDDKLDYILDHMTDAKYIKTFDIKWERKENE